MDKYFRYLEKLRDSGETNMFGAAPYLQWEFPELRYNPNRAQEILLAWFILKLVKSLKSFFTSFYETARCAERSVSVRSTWDFQLKHLIENQYQIF